MTMSMTGFAAGKGAYDAWRWTWDLRSVNGRGLDLRLRIPDWVEGLEPALRDATRSAMTRGSVTLSLKLSRDEASSAFQVSRETLDAVLGAISLIEARAKETGGLTLSPSTATDILGLCRNSAPAELDEKEMAGLLAAISADFSALLAVFRESRSNEGAKLREIILAQVERIETLAAEAAERASDRQQDQAETLRANMARVLENSEGADEARVAQELALLAVKSDVTEEIDRLHAHVATARELLASDGPVGRKLDFLTQEFNREANTLCSKAQSRKLTSVGLDLKAVIDQMREQVQNVE